MSSVDLVKDDATLCYYAYDLRMSFKGIFARFMNMQEKKIVAILIETQKEKWG